MTVLKDLLNKVKGNIPKNCKRSGQWSTVRKTHLIQHPICEACGETNKLEVHHIVPFHMNPELELDPDNLITLCEVASNGVVCHQNIGHNGNYKSWNINVREDSQAMLNRLTNRPFIEDK